MALLIETTISHIVQVALDKALSCLQNGVELFFGAQDRLVKIKDSLVDIHDFIEIAEGSPKKDPKLMKLLEKLKDAAYDVDDLLEEYEIVTSPGNITQFIDRAQISWKLQKLSEKLEDIKAEGHAFQLKEKVTNLMIEFEKQRETHSLVTKSQVFGRDKEKENIVSFLLSPQPQVGDGVEDDENENVSVIPIVGMGGLGKTTLAKLVFNHGVVQNHFEMRMWICVSYDFDIIRLGNEIIERATRHNPSLSNVEELQLRLGETLSGKKFLLVLDDVWNEEPEKWYKLRDLLLCGGRGSRIVVTTRSRKVASIISNIQPHILKPLPEDGCWSLFCQRAFGNPKAAVAHSNLAPIGRDIVKKCGGNPLAVTTLGGLLCTERSQRKWESVKDSEMWNLDDENEKGVLPALRLSYNYLKPHLKQCFAFCAIFPQDYEIEKELVIKLWMAQGFIPTKRGKELEDTGDEIFDELVMKSFFEDVKENKYWCNGEYGGFHRIRTAFRMHDLMHDLVHSVMENEYCVVHDGKSKDISPRIRHVSSNGLGILAASLPKAQMLRTYVMLEQVGFQFPCDVGLFKCLRALDFIMQIDKQKVEKQLFISLGNLQHLRYLNLSFTLIEMLPESLTSLCYLQTLILISCRELCELPKEMCKLTNLRCLDITGCFKLTHMPPKMGQLSCLQELSNFIVGGTNENACSGIGELQGLNLRGRLKIQLLKNITDAIDVPRGTLINKPNLTSLELLWEVEFGTSEDDRKREVIEQQVLQGLQPHLNLKKLGIFQYEGLNFPSWMMDTTLTELVEIKLSGCWKCNHLPPLGELPFLKVLRIDGLKNVECIGNEFYGNEVSGGFPSLEELTIHNMQKLNHLPPLGELPFLKVLEISRLKNVECIGNEFYGNEVSGGFPSLEKLEIEHMEKLKTWSGLEWKGERAFPSLFHLEIQGCPMLTTVELFPYIKDLNVDQGMMQSLKNLETLQILNCPRHNVTSFESMHQQNCNQSSFADEDQIRSQSSLQYLRIMSCDKLIFSGLGLRYFSSLETLRIDDSNEFAHVAHELSFLTSLQYLSLNLCHGLKSLPEGIGNLTSLRRLVIRNCPQMASLPRELQRLSALQQLGIDGCHGLKSLPEGIGNLTSLQVLEIINCREMASFPRELQRLSALQNLIIKGCHGLKSLPEGIGNLTSLRSLYIYNCPEMVSLPRELQRLYALKQLKISGCHTLEIRCTKDSGEDWDKIQHIPLIEIGGRLIARD